MEYTYFLIVNSSVFEKFSLVLKHIAKQIGAKLLIRKLSVGENEYMYMIKMSKGPLFGGVDFERPDVLIISNRVNEQLLGFLKKFIKDKTYMLITKDISNSIFSELVSEKGQEENVILSDTDDVLIGNALLVTSRFFSVKFNTIIKALKSINDVDTTSLIETFKLVARNARVSRT